MIILWKALKIYVYHVCKNHVCMSNCSLEGIQEESKTPNEVFSKDICDWSSKIKWFLYCKTLQWDYLAMALDCTSSRPSQLRTGTWPSTVVGFMIPHSSIDSILLSSNSTWDKRRINVDCRSEEGKLFYVLPQHQIWSKY